MDNLRRLKQFTDPEYEIPVLASFVTKAKATDSLDEISTNRRQMAWIILA